MKSVSDPTSEKHLWLHKILLLIPWIPLAQISCGQVPHLQELPEQYVPRLGGACKEVNSRVRPTQFINGREHGFPRYPIWKRLDIINHNSFHFCRAQVSDIPIVERGGIQLGRSVFSYVWDGWSINVKVCTSGMWGSYKNDIENHRRGHEGQIEGPYPV